MATPYPSFLDQDPNDLLAPPRKRALKMSGVPYSDAEINAMPRLESAPGVPLDATPPTGEGRPRAGEPTVLKGAEGTRIGVGSQDAALLDALGPEYAAEGQRLAAAPSAKRQPITGRNETTGESFVMPIGNRVSRQTLAPAIQRIATQQLEQKLKEQQAAKFAQDQTMARIPGQSAVDLAKTKGDYGMRSQESQQQFQTPVRDADVAQTKQRTAGMAGQQSRDAQSFADANSPQAKQRAAADQAIEMLTRAGLHNTPEGKQTIAALAALSSIGSNLPAGTAQSFAQAASGTNPAQQFDAYSELLNDPQVAKAVDAVKANKQGMFYSTKRREGADNAEKQLKSYVKRFAQAKGLNFDEVWQDIVPQLAAARNG